MPESRRTSSKPVRISPRALTRRAVIGGALGLSLGGCSRSVSLEPAVEFTEIPESAPGGSARIERIAGRVTGAAPGQRIVLFAKSGTWWIQPFANKPFTEIADDGVWESTTHMGSDYAALLVDAGYLPPKVADELPAPGAGVVAVAAVPGLVLEPSATPPPKKILFSGYEWDVLQEPRDSNGVMHQNRGSNAWIDDKGRLHLQLVREGDGWAGAEIVLTRSLGYGTYSFVFRELPELEAATVLGMLTYDPLESGQNHRELDIQVSRWGDPAIHNAQFVVQPHYVAANVHRFPAPSGSTTHAFEWRAGEVAFQTVQSREGGESRVIAEHRFTSGVPTPGGERVHLNLFVYGHARTPQENSVEVVLEEFSHMP